MKLTLENIEVWHGNSQVLCDINLEVAGGHMVGVFGRNGAGKSTLIQAIQGSVRPRAGHIRLGNHDLSRFGMHQRAQIGLATVEEGRSVFADLSVEENLRVATAGDTSDSYLIFPELARRARVKAGALSGGEQQMVALARALATRPRCLVVDEMSIGLAPTIVQRLIATLRAVADSGVAVVVVDQFARTVAPHCDRSHLLVNGSLSPWDASTSSERYFG